MPRRIQKSRLSFGTPAWYDGGGQRALPPAPSQKRGELFFEAFQPVGDCAKPGGLRKLISAILPTERPRF
ncbi:hypothetical protein HMPREF0262_00074 [Clostridium sp. ATCC 29733]|nr:hypothetical protein HMPREF0262_00074 [Clostridium sp. ATCC 29733]